MDRFVRNALLLCLSISILILCLSFVGTALLGQQFKGTDEKIKSAVGSEDQAPILSIPVNEDLKPVLFGMIGVVGGFVCGFFYVDVFYRKGDAHG